MKRSTGPHRVSSIHKARVVALGKQLLARRSRLQLLALAVFALGVVALLLESATLGGCRAVRHGVEIAQFAWQRVTGAEIQEPVPTTPAPPSAFATATERLCYYLRDVGLESEIRAAQQTFCASQGRTEVSLIDLKARHFNMRAMMFKRDLQLDFTRATIHQPIASLAEDGGAHDPRFNWDDAMVSCGCDELQSFAAKQFADSGNTTTLRLWDPQFMNTPAEFDAPASVCAASTASQGAESIEIREKTILIARRDDHNPFFQISNALNAWLLMRTFGWTREETRVIHMDGGYESPIDALHHNLLSSPDKFEILRGRADLMGRRFAFTNDVIVAPYEVSGPMMQHLNNKEPCHDSHLFKEFRAQSLEALGVSDDDFDTSRQITVTIITRRNYGGRTVQRRWLNEDEVLAAMRAKYTNHNGVPIVIQSVDFVDLTLAEQMEIALTSDVVIGMHGAGMVNVLWTKPETLVVEIFPKRRWRWGYRNLCQFLGCDWRQFRGGQDTGKGDNASDKTIPVDQWEAFFDPVFGEYLSKLASTKRAPSALFQQPQALRRPQ